VQRRPIRACIVLGGCCALFAIALALAGHSVRAFLVVALSLLAIGLAQSVSGLQQHLVSQTRDGPAPQFARGTFVNRDHYAALMEGSFGLALGLALAMTAGLNWRRWLAGRARSLAMAALLVAGACGTAVVFSYSRMRILVVSMDGCNTSPKGEVDAEEIEEEAARLHGSGAGRGI